MEKKPLQEGIYFNLSDEDYRNDPALSRSGMGDLLKSDQDFYINSPFNPKRDKREYTPGQMFGLYSEELLLDPEKFHATYRIIGHEKWAEGRDKPKSIDLITYRKVKESVDIIMENDLSRDLFTGGYPQVTIIWFDADFGVMFKCRIDYLLPFAGVDFKRLRDIAPETIGYLFGDGDYDIQDVHYTIGIDTAKKRLREKDKTFKVIGPVSKKWLKEFMNTAETFFTFLCQRSTSPYIFDEFRHDEALKQNGVLKRHAAVIRFAEYLRKYGTGAPPFTSGKVHILTPFQYSKRAMDKGINLTN